MEPEKLINSDAISIAKNIREGKISAVKVTQETLENIATRDRELNCFTNVTMETALLGAAKIDQQISQGQNPGLLAGVPFAVKNLFDIAGLRTLAGSKINADNPPARKNATAIAKLEQAGAILVGALNMDEYAYGFVTENYHYGTTRNPHDITCIAGGSSGGSAAAVAGGLVPISLGSDTNGSVRVPAALCGVYGFKPTYGRLSRAGVALLSSSLDHVGTFARSVEDIALMFDILQGYDENDPVSTHKEPELCFPQIHRGMDGLRVAIALADCKSIALADCKSIALADCKSNDDNYFAQKLQPEALAAVTKVAQALNVNQYIKIPEVHRARAAAFVITATEGANLHLEKIRQRPQDFDPETRDRFIAGALIPSSWYLQAQRFRRWYRDRVREIFTQVDVILAPTTPIAAPLIGQKTMILDGEEISIRPYLGQFTQPFSFIGLPVLSVPVQLKNSLPLGVQLIAAPFNEVAILRVAAVLQKMGVVSVGRG